MLWHILRMSVWLRCHNTFSLFDLNTFSAECYSIVDVLNERMIQIVFFNKLLCKFVIVIVLMKEYAICFRSVDFYFDHSSVKKKHTDQCTSRIKTTLTELH